MRQDETGNGGAVCRCKREIVVKGLLRRAEYLCLEVSQRCPSVEFLTELVDGFLVKILPAIGDGADLVNWKGREPEGVIDRSPDDNFNCFVGEGVFGLPGASLEPFAVKVDCLFDDFAERGAIRYRIDSSRQGALPEWIPTRLVGRSYSISWTKVLISLERFKPTLVSGLLGLMPVVEDQIQIEASAEVVQVNLVLKLGRRGGILDGAPVVEGYVRDILGALNQDVDRLLMSR